MAAETLVALAVVAVLAFVAGWIARGRADHAEAAGPEVEVAAEPIDIAPRRRGQTPSARDGGQTPPRREGGLTPSAPDPAAATARLLDRAVTAFEAAVERWLDEGDAITPAGKAALGELDRAIQRADVAAVRIEEGTEPRFSALDALDALRQASQILQAYREGRAIDAGSSRELDRLEDEIRRARAGVAA
jgi:hypothetical protein